MAKNEDQIKEEFFFYKNENNLLREKLIGLYNQFLKEYREFLSKDYAELTLYDACFSASQYAVNVDGEEGGQFYTELLVDWYEEQLAEFNERVERTVNDYMVVYLEVVDEEGGELEFGKILRPVIFDINDWGALLVVGENHLVENDTKGIEHIVNTVEMYNFPIYSEEDFAREDEYGEGLRAEYGNYKKYSELMEQSSLIVKPSWKLALDPEFQYNKWTYRPVESPEDALDLAKSLNEYLERMVNDIEAIRIGLQKSEQAHLFLKENYLDDDKAKEAFKTWIATKGY
jgi:hypothetical protein